MTRRSPLLPAVLATLIGCAHVHLDRDAPGIVDLSKPPKDLAARHVERPADPGEEMLAFTYGALGGACVRFAGDRDARFAWTV